MKNGRHSCCKDCSKKKVQASYYKTLSWKKYWEKNKEKFKPIRERYRKDTRKKATDHLGGKCKKCGFDDERALQIDHINGDGIKDRNKQITGFYKRVIEDTENKYQLLCANCNAIKRIENKEFGIQWKKKTTLL